MDAKRILSIVAFAAALLVGSQAQAAEEQETSVSVEVLSATATTTMTATPVVIQFSAEFELAFMELVASAEPELGAADGLSCERGCVLEYNACMWDYGMSCEPSLDECSSTCE